MEMPLEQNEASIEQLNQIVTACCILHNVCENKRDKFDEALCSDQHEPSTASSNTTSETQSARADEIRAAKSRSPTESFGVVRQQGGNSDNPTPVHTNHLQVASGNCEIDDNELIANL
eukprot:gene9851-18433_t